jgi:hypothetical protein
VTATKVVSVFHWPDTLKCVTYGASAQREAGAAAGRKRLDDPAASGLEGRDQLQLFKHTVATSPMHIASQLFEQQYGSTAQIFDTQFAFVESQPFLSVPPAVQTLCVQLPFASLHLRLLPNLSCEHVLPPPPPLLLPTPTAVHAAVTDAISAVVYPSCVAACSVAVLAWAIVLVEVMINSALYQIWAAFAIPMPVTTVELLPFGCVPPLTSRQNARFGTPEL